MPRSPLAGRRIHIAGSINVDPQVATSTEVDSARDFVTAFVRELVRRGAGFVVAVDAEKRREIDGKPICFDWLVWECLKNGLPLRPAGASVPLAVAVQHHKSEAQVPLEMQDLWDDLRGSDLVTIENAAQWNMNSKRLEVAASFGDVLVTLGGDEGVLFLANLYHVCGKPVVPLNFRLCPDGKGSLRLFEHGMTRAYSGRFFSLREQPEAHAWMNRINQGPRATVDDRVNAVISLLEALERPRAFAVRLLNPKHVDFAAVDNFFSSVVQPVAEETFGYKLTAVDGRQPYETPRVDQEIFSKLHRSGIVVADFTGLRPNCFVELGYALGRGHPTLLTAREGTENPFDTQTLPAHFWVESGTAADRRHRFVEYWQASAGRPPLVPSDPLIP